MLELYVDIGIARNLFWGSYRIEVPRSRRRRRRWEKGRGDVPSPAY